MKLFMKDSSLNTKIVMKKDRQMYETKTKSKQADTGSSQRHILGSKIAKGLQNVKLLVNWEPFYEKN